MERFASYPSKRPEDKPFFVPVRMNFAHLTEEDWEAAARELGCEVNVLKAVGMNESKGNGFNYRGRATMIFEPDHFAQYTHHVFDKAYPELTHTNWHHYGTYQTQWDRLEAAHRLDSRAALKASSWGQFQILGEAYVSAGYGTVELFVDKMCSSEKAQLDVFVRYSKAYPGLLKALQEKDWNNIALYYNGSAYRRTHYNALLKEEYDRLAK